MASGEEANNIVTGKLRYSSVLDVSVFAIYQDHSMRYKAKINTQPGLPKVVYIIINILIIIQLIGPAFFVDSPILWDRESVFTYFLRSIGCVWQLWAGPSRVVGGLVIGLLMLVYELVTALLIYRFSKRQIADRAEGVVVLLVGKYIRPILFVLVFSALPTALYSLSEIVSILYLIVLIICAIAAPFDMYILSARILVENNPNHEWQPIVPTVTWISTALIVMFSSSVGLAGKVGQAAFMIICAAVYAFYASFNYIYSSTVKRQFSVLLGSIASSGCVLSLISVILLFVGEVSPAVLIILFIVVLIISYIVLHFLNRKRTANILMIFSQCENCPDDSDEILTRAFPSPLKFIAAVHIVFQHWHPFLLSWKPFSTYMQKYPDNHEICILWCRICSLFPQEHELFRWLINQYSNLRPHVSRTSYLTQMTTLQSSRFTDTMPSVLKSIATINRHIGNAIALQHRFWERILQKSVDMFWNDIASMKKIVDKIEIDINQLLDSYPNNTEIVELYCSFLLNVKADFSGYQDWSNKLHQLQAGNRLHPDFALQAAQLFLPELQQFCIESQSKKPDDLSVSIQPDKVTEINHQLQQVRVGLQQFIKKASVGSILIGTIILIIGTAAAIGVFALYKTEFDSYLVKNNLQKGNFMREVNIGLMNLGFLAIYVGIYPLAITGQWIPCNLVPQYCPLIMNSLAPNLYPEGKIPNWTLDSTFIGAIVAEARSRLLNIQYSLSNLTDSPGAQQIYQDMFITPFYEGLPVIQVLTKYMIDATTLMKIVDAQSFLTDPLLSAFDMGIQIVIEEMNKYPNLMWEVSVSESDENLTNLNQYFVLTIFITFLFISLPLILTHFMLVVESNSVSSAFTSLPNTAVREILQSRDKKGNGKSHGSQTIALSTASNTIKNKIEIYLIFILSCGCVLASSLYLYFQSSLSSERANKDLQKISILHKPAIYSLTAAYRLEKLVTIDLLTQAGPPFSFLTSFIGYNRSTQMFIAKQMIEELHNSTTNGIWGINGIAGDYYHSNTTIDYFNDVIPGITDKEVSNPLSLFEEMVSTDILDEFELAATNMEFILMQAETSLVTNTNNQYFNPLIYFFSTFAGTYRFPQFFNPVIEEIYLDFTSIEGTLVILLIIVIIVQIIALFVMIGYLYHKSSIIKQSLSMLLFFNPTVVLQNQNVMSLITTGSLKAYNDENTYKDAEKVLECTNESVVLMDKKLIINDINDSFITCVGLAKEEITGKCITDIFKSVSKLQSIETVMLRVYEALRGNTSPSFKEKMAVSIPDGTEKIVIVNVLCLTPMGTATESDFNEINAVVFIIEDQTEHQLIEQKIHDEKQKITEMLNRVMPSNVVEELQKGSDSISLAVQSASVGCIKVTTNAQFDNEDFNAPFQFFAKVYSFLDEMMKEFPQLTKVRTFSHTYEYAGGLFGSVNKPDKHAEEATRFALKVITNAKKIGEAVGQEISFTIGLNTGGPLVAGVISVNKPNFHLIGPTVELAQRMKSTGIKMQVHVTRSVYELVYAYNFHVTERGDTDIGGGRTLRTYVIVP